MRKHEREVICTVTKDQVDRLIDNIRADGDIDEPLIIGISLAIWGEESGYDYEDFYLYEENYVS